MNTDTKQDEQRDREFLVDINAAPVGEHSDTTTYQGPTPYHTEDQKIADIDTDQDVEQKMESL